MDVKIKKLNENAVIPKYAHDTDAGLDLVAINKEYDTYGNVQYDTGLAMEIPEGYVGLLFPRSSVYKQNLSLCNCVGVIDSGYRGSIKFNFRLVGKYFSNVYNVGDKTGQIIIMPYPKINFVEVEELSDSDRGKNGFGSTDKK